MKTELLSFGIGVSAKLKRRPEVSEIQAIGKRLLGLPGVHAPVLRYTLDGNLTLLAAVRCLTKEAAATIVCDALARELDRFDIEIDGHIAVTKVDSLAEVS